MVNLKRVCVLWAEASPDDRFSRGVDGSANLGPSYLP